MTDRAKIANVRSMLDQKQGKSRRRVAKGGRELVPTGRRQGGGTQLRAANDSVSLADRARAELQNMEEAKLFSDRQLELLGIVHPRSKDRALVDAFRQLRTKLYSLREGNFSVLVSSVVPGGGGSFVGLNLAATIAFDKAKTSLLVDANLHDPIVHRLQKLIGREDSHGLIDYLEHPELGIEHIVSPSGVPRMRVIPIGRNGGEISAEHFTSARYRQLMADIQSRYDNRFVVVDGPAMSTSADARILSDLCDYTVLVVPYGGVTPGTLDAIVDEIDERRLAGIVVNDQPIG